MRHDHVYPSFWSGVAATKYPFEDTVDYSLWACGLLESGHDTANVSVLAGLFGEENRFELAHWHRQALRDLRYNDLNDRELFLAHLRGYAEEFIDGKRDFKDITRHFHDLQIDEGDELLEDLISLHYGYWDFECFDMSDMGISSLEDFPHACTKACEDLIKKIQAEQTVAPSRSLSPSQNPKSSVSGSED